MFRFAKRRKPLRLRSSSPKVFRLSGSPLNHRRRFAGYAHQGEAPSNTVQNEFRTMRAKRSWGRSTGQRLPPPRTDFRTIGHIDELHSETGARPPVRGLGGGSRSGMAQGVCRAPVPHPPTLAGVFKKKRRRQSGFQHLRSPKVSKGGACRQAENRSMNTGNRLPRDFSKKHSPTAEIKISHNFSFSFKQNFRLAV